MTSRYLLYGLIAINISYKIDLRYMVLLDRFCLCTTICVILRFSEWRIHIGQEVFSFPNQATASRKYVNMHVTASSERYGDEPVNRIEFV